MFNESIITFSSLPNLRKIFNEVVFGAEIEIRGTPFGLHFHLRLFVIDDCRGGSAEIRRRFIRRCGGFRPFYLLFVLFNLSAASAAASAIHPQTGRSASTYAIELLKIFEGKGALEIIIKNLITGFFNRVDAGILTLVAH